MNAKVLAAVTLLAASFGLHAATDDPFVVHEWGTFTTVQGADGAQIWWEPPASVDLPEFVYRADINGGWIGNSAIPQVRKDRSALARMETPVIYFYSQRERVADVRMVFRGGDVTEWYPQDFRHSARARTIHSGNSVIEWNGVKILPRDTRG